MNKNQRKIKRIFSIFILAFLCFVCVSCEGLKKLKLNESRQLITLENDKVKIIFNKSSGGIYEYKNKESDLYFVKGVSDATPIRIAVAAGDSSSASEKYLTYTSFEYITEKTKEAAIINFKWEFENETIVLGSAKLEINSDEVVFNVKLLNNKISKPTYSVEYPILEKIDTLDKHETDYLVTPFAMGYLFNNPIDNFSSGTNSASGIDKNNGLYPSGMYQSMQFYGYYSDGLGGFYVQTRDGGEHEKSFTFMSINGKLRSSIWHYVQNLRPGDKEFNYDIVFANLVKGNWYEAADRYKTWATQQAWCQEKGKNSERTDLNKELYEETVLCNFIEPSKSNQEGAADIYKKIREQLGSKILVIPYYWNLIPTPLLTDDTSILTHYNGISDKEFYKAINDYDDLVAYFEYFNCALSNAIPKGLEDNKMLDTRGINHSSVFGATAFIHQCPSEEWNELVYNREHVIANQLKADGYYNDIGIGAAVKTLCYNYNHAHGSKVSVLEESLKQLEEVYNISRQYGGFTGQEMISELMIPYVDIYQCRANAGEMGGMENDIIMDYVKNGSAEKIHLFEYIYKEYCGIRLDGFTLPIESVGTPYYYVTAFTALNGGIPEYNWEWTGDYTYPTAEEYSSVMIDFINTLGQVRKTYGKNYLVYGNMVQAPNIGTGKSRFSYSTPINNSDGSWSDFENQGNKVGEMLCDNVVVSAFEYDGKIAIFLCNITEDSISLNFGLDALEMYGISSGNIYSYNNDNRSLQASINNGKANIGLNLPSREVVMLVIE